MSEEQKKFYRSGFFGRLIVETTHDKSRAFFLDEPPDAGPWVDWEVVERNGDSYVTRCKDPESGEWTIKSVVRNGDCYRVDQPQLGFGEWFCKAPG